VGGPEHPLTSFSEVSVEQLRTCAPLCVDRLDGFQARFVRRLADVGQPPRLLTLGSIDAVKQSLIAGFGIALLPVVTVADELASGRLRRVNWLPPFEVYAQLAWRGDLRCNSAFRAMFDAVIQVFDERGRPLPYATGA